MMRRHLTLPDARLVHTGKAVLAVHVADRRSAAATAGNPPVGEVNPPWRCGHGTHPPVPDHRAVVLVAVEYGCGRCGCPSPGTARWGAFRERFFAAGHGHAGVVLVLPLTYFIYLG